MILFLHLWIINDISAQSILTLMIPIFITTLGIGLIRPTASAGAMTSTPHEIAGFAAAGFSLLSFIGGALLTTLASLWITTMVAFGLFIALFGSIAVIYATRCNVALKSGFEQPNF